MKNNANTLVQSFFSENLTLECCKGSVIQAIELIIKSYRDGGKLLACGNGGSASDSEHIVGELMKGFVLRRLLSEEEKSVFDKLSISDERKSHITDNLQGALPAISLVSHTALISAYTNDVQPDMVFAQQVYGYGRSGDVFVGLSTSGNSENVLNAAYVAGAKGLKSIAFTGEKDSKLSQTCDCTIQVPSSETYRVQEMHIKIYHLICLAIEAEFFGDEEVV